MRDNRLYEEIRELVSHIVEQTNDEVDKRRSIKKKRLKTRKRKISVKRRRTVEKELENHFIRIESILTQIKEYFQERVKNQS